MTPATQAIPADPVLERHVLGIALGGGDETVLALRDLIAPGDFFTPEHGQLFGAILAVQDSGAPMELAAVAAELRRRGLMDKIGPDKTDAGGAAYVAELAEGYGFDTANARHYAERLHGLSARRELIRLAQSLNVKARQPEADAAALVEAAQRDLYELGCGAGDPAEPVSAGEAVAAAIARAEAVKAGEQRPGLPTGFGGIDRATGGMAPGDLWTLGAATSVGKTAFAHTVAACAAEEGGAVLIVSAEIDRLAVGNRLLAIVSGVDSSRLRAGNLDETEHAARQVAAERIAAWRLAVFDRAASVPEIAVRARLLSARWRRPLSLIVADYLQLMRPDPGPGRQTRAQEIGGIAWGLKQLAMDLGCPVLMLSQLNREGVKYEDDRPPGLYHLKESGDVENHSNVVLLLHRPRGIAPDGAGAWPVWTKVAKARDGRTTPWPSATGYAAGSIVLRFRAACTRFENG